MPDFFVYGVALRISSNSKASYSHIEHELTFGKNRESELTVRILLSFVCLLYLWCNCFFLRLCYNVLDIKERIQSQ